VLLLKASRLAIAATTAVALFIFPASSHAAPGDINTAFSGHGISLVSPITTSSAVATKPYIVRIASNGAVVAAGTANENVWVARYTAAGVLDTSFSEDGYFEHDLDGGTWDEPKELRLDSTGRVVLAGRAGDDAFVLRLTTAGALDPGFASDGVLIHHDSTWSMEFAGMDLQSDGRIVVASSSLGFGQVRRYTTTGELDASFTGGGSVDLDAPGFGSELQVEVDPSDRIVLGSTQQGNAIRLARLTADGVPDNSFDDDGRLDLNNGLFRGLAVDSLGNILIASSVDPTIVISRLTSASGEFDNTWDGNGTANFEPSGALADVRDIATVGQYVFIGGYTGLTEGGFVAGFTDAGALDSAYETVGPPDNASVECKADGTSCPFVAIDANATGQVAWAAEDEQSSVAIANIGRLGATGLPDNGFSEDGFVTLSDDNPDSARASASTTRPDGTTIVAGFGGPYNSESLALTAFKADGSLDSSFGGDGIVVEDVLPGESDYVNDVAIDATNRVYVYGTHYSSPGSSVFVLRYEADGTRDMSFAGDGKSEFDPTVYDSDFAGGIAPAADGGYFLNGSTYIDSVNRGTWCAKFASTGSQDPAWNGGVTASRNLSAVSGLTAGNIIEAADGGIAYAFVSSLDLHVISLDAAGAGRAGFGSSGAKYLGSQDVDWNGQPRLVPVGSDFLVVLSTYDGRVKVAKISGLTGDLIPDFGTDGIAVLDDTIGLPSNERTPFASVDSGGRITVAATTDGLGPSHGVFLARLTPNGQPDLTFSATGWRTQLLPLGLSVNSLAGLVRVGLNNTIFGSASDPQSGEHSFYAASIVSDDPVPVVPPPAMVIPPPVTLPDLTACNRAKKKLSALKKTLAKQKKTLKKAKSASKKKSLKRQIKSTNKKITSARKSVKKACA
jgi:uncharacterized delta-60 repeat protein